MLDSRRSTLIRIRTDALRHHTVVGGYEAGDPLSDLWTLLPSDLSNVLQRALERAGYPRRASVGLARLFESVEDISRLVRPLATKPQLVEALVKVLAGSAYLPEILLRTQDGLRYLEQALTAPLPRSREGVAALVLAPLDSTLSFDQACDLLRCVQKRLLLAIGARDLLGLANLSEVTRALAHLADALVMACLKIASQDTETPPDGFVVLALGKLGGEELNYSSDIDLVFLARRDSRAYTPLAERLLEALTRTTGEGFLYRVDLRLRPWGQVGPLVSSMDAYLDYVARHARLWEKQALLKARPVAGNKILGHAML